MKYAVAALAAALLLAVGGNVYQAIPGKSPTPKHTPAYQRVDKFLAAVQKGDYKTAAEVFSWYCANQWMDEAACATALQASFSGSHMVYRIVGEVQATPKYVVVIVAMALNDPSTKLDEPAFCAAQWAKGEGCKYAGVYTFGVALSESPADAFSEKKNAVQHWYPFWVN